MNNSYCSLAWLGITTDPDGSLRPCCISNDKVTKPDGTPYNLGVDSLEDIYNSKFYIKLRNAMLAGDHIPGCQACYSNEQNGRESRRLINNQKFKDLIFSTETVDTNIKYFDLRLSNLCNLKCRMCSPVNSSLIAEELSDNPDPVLEKFYFKSDAVVENWSDTEVFDNNINSQLKNIDTLYITGGEPTVIKKNYDILERLIAENKRDVTVIINTNMTNSNPKFYELIKQFDKVIIQMSIDAVGSLDAYIRYPTDFTIVDKTIKELLALGNNIQLLATPVIQALNLNNLVELFDYLERFNHDAGKQVIDIRPNFLYQPEHLSIDFLPKEYKMHCYRKLFMWMQGCKYQSKVFKDTMQALKNKCYEDKYDQEKHQAFLEFNTALDNIRNMSLQEYNKELYEVLQ